MPQNNNIFLDFETNLIQNMQSLNILKSNKEYILRNINTPFRKWLYSGKTESTKGCAPFEILNNEVNSSAVLFPKLHINLNKLQNTFTSKYNLYEISADNHPMVDDSIKLLKTLSKRIPCSKNNTLLGQTKSTLTDTRSAFNSLRNALEKLTDVKFGGAFDLFSQNSAKSSNEDVIILIKM
mgnify:CR=1 FL=1